MIFCPSQCSFLTSTQEAQCHFTYECTLKKLEYKWIRKFRSRRHINHPKQSTHECNPRGTLLPLYSVRINYSQESATKWIAENGINLRDTLSSIRSPELKFSSHGIFEVTCDQIRNSCSAYSPMSKYRLLKQSISPAQGWLKPKS